MSGIRSSKHAEVRQHQRGFMRGDISQLLMLSEQLDDHTVFVTRRAAAERIRLLKAQIHQLEPLRAGRCLSLVSACPATRLEEKRCLRSEQKI